MFRWVKKNKQKIVQKFEKLHIYGFDEKAYLSANPDVFYAIEKGQFKDAKHHLKLFGLKEIKEGKRRFHVDYIPYDENLYINSLSKTHQKNLQDKYNTVFEHFCKIGYVEIINNKFYPSSVELFDRKWYKKKYSDIEQLDIDPLQHYIRFGWKEGRDPHPLFQTNMYLQGEENLEKKLLDINSNPLTHYLSTGKNEKKEIFYNELTHQFKSYNCSFSPLLYEVKTDAKVSFRAGAFIHIYYIDIGDVLIEECLKKGLDVHVAFIEGTDYGRLVKKYKHKINYKIFQNRGRDIAPFLLGFKKELYEYEYAIHLHTKKSLHYGQERKDWLEYCLESLMGNINKVKETFYEDREVAIIFPEPPDFIKEQMNWGHNFNRVYKLMEMLNMEINKYCTLDFPAGSMFWFRVQDLKPIFDLNITLPLFDDEKGQLDGTLAHAIERLFGVYVLKRNKKIIPIRYKNTTIFTFNKRIDKSHLRIHKNNKSEETYSLAYKYFYTELHPLTFTYNTNKRRRVNILLPTINPEHVFGGISTALSFFFKIVNELKCDCRILTTDSNTNLFTTKKYPEFSNYTLDYLNDDDPKYILSLSQRHLGDLPVRSNDVFIATAWWTAYHLEKIEEYQKKQYQTAPKHIYFIQDYEPHFYGWSTKHELAYNTYKNNWVSIYNTELLYIYFKNKGLLPEYDYILKPELNENIKNELLNLNKTKKEKIILLYGRPSAIRNCNEVILEAISMFRKNDDKNNKWKIISLGETYSHPLVNELDIEVLGKVTLEEYANLLAKSFLGVSLMISPHPSYPPFEMIAANLYVYTSKYENKNATSLQQANLTIDATDAEKIYKFISEKIKLYNENNYYDSDRINHISFGNGLMIDQVIEKVVNNIKEIK